MTTTAKKTKPLKDTGKFLPIPVAGILAMNSLGMSLYCFRENDTKPSLLCGERHTQTAEQLAEVCDSHYDSLLISPQDFPSFSQKMLGLLDQILVDNSISLEVRLSLVQIAYADRIERLFRKSSMKQYVELSQEVGKCISSLIQQGEVSAQTLFGHAHHSSSHYSHVTNVSAYGVLLAKALDITSPEELEHIAVGCMLHEVGKLYLPEKLLNKKGRLSPHDHEELNRVPILAYEILSEFPTVGFSQLMMAYQQGEHVDGTGYPVRIMNEEIHAWAKLLAVVDAFDAITSERPFRPASSMQDGLIMLADNANTHFEPEMVLCWISTFQLQ